MTVLLAAAVLGAAVADPDRAAAEIDPPHRSVVFPVFGGASFRNDWGDCRSGCTRRHMGNDLYAPKLTPVVAAFDGEVVNLDPDPDTIAGVNLTIRADDGWMARYVHLNNDTPGTNDNANPAAWRFMPGLALGTRVTLGQHLSWIGNSGNAENSSPHLHFEMYTPSGEPVNPYESLRLALGQRGEVQCAVASNPPLKPRSGISGYWVASTAGGIYTYGAAPFHGSVAEIPLAQPIVDIAPRPGADGYWLLGRDGGVFGFGAAGFHGSTGGIPLNAPVVAMAPTPTGNGYWFVAADGGVFNYGDAAFFGSTGAMTLNAPIVGMAATPTGAGYWLVASDGGIFGFGDATFYGSTGGFTLAQPVVAMAARKAGDGYWLIGSDGGIFSFGSAGYHGSLPGLGRCSWLPARDFVRSEGGDGYYILSIDGTVRSFGDAPEDGDPSVLGVQAAGIAGFV